MSTNSSDSASKPRVTPFSAFAFSTTTLPSSPAFSTIWRMGSSSARLTIMAPTFSSPSSLRLSMTIAARSRATPPPGTIPSSTAARVALSASSTRAFFSFMAVSVAVPTFVSGAMAEAGKGLLDGTLQAGTSAVSDKLLDLVGLGGKSAADKGKDTRDYLAAAFPELNAWERAGADASSAGMVDAGFENQKELTKMQLDNQKEIAEMQNETQKEIAGIQSATSRQNTKDQVYAQNEMLAYQQK